MDRALKQRFAASLSADMKNCPWAVGTVPVGGHDCAHFFLLIWRVCAVRVSHVSSMSMLALRRVQVGELLRATISIQSINGSTVPDGRTIQHLPIVSA